MFSGSEPCHLESLSKWSVFSALGKTEPEAGDLGYCILTHSDMLGYCILTLIMKHFSQEQKEAINL